MLPLAACTLTGDEYLPRRLEPAPESDSQLSPAAPAAAERAEPDAPVEPQAAALRPAEEMIAGCSNPAQPADCQSMTCTDRVCAPPSCTDGVHDGFESDRDCGGACEPCALGAACIVDTDCASASCVGAVCVASSHI